MTISANGPFRPPPPTFIRLVLQFVRLFPQNSQEVPILKGLFFQTFHAMHVFMMVSCNACLYDVVRHRSNRRKPTQARGEHANSTQKGPGTTWNDQDSDPGPSCCEATVLTTEPPCCRSMITQDRKSGV